MSIKTFENMTGRAVECELSYLSQSDGSVKLKHGKTSLIVAINGPLEVKMNKELVDRMNVDVTFKYKTLDMKVKNQKYIEKIIQDICESQVLVKTNPRTNLSVSIQELEDDGSMISCAINATCLALLDACIPLKSTFTAVNVCYDENKDNCIVDPNAQQEADLGSITFVFSGNNLSIISVYSNAFFSERVMERCLSEAKTQTKILSNYFRERLVQLHSFD